MTSVSARTKLSGVGLQQVALDMPWEAFVLPVSAFPVPEAELVLLEAFLAKFSAAASRRWGLSREVFIQLEQFQNDQARRIYMRGAPDWIPEVGLGVWPDREPPASWTRDEFEEAALQNKAPKPLMYQVFHITGLERAKLQAHQQLLPFGPVLEILTKGGAPSIFDRGDTSLLPAIVDPSFTCFPFYVPLMEAKTVPSMRSDRLINLLGDSIYIRESFEDNGVLFVASQPLSQIFRELGGEHEPEDSLSWRVPL